MTTVSPPVSIGLPVYNGERHLRGALESILGQTFGDFTLLISDNGSTDHTEEICREAARRDQRVVYRRSERNRGAAWNFSYVATQCTSPLFRFASHDDLLASTLLERCMDAHDADPAAVLWYPQTVEIDADGRVVRPFTDSLHLTDERPHRRLRDLLDRYNTSNAIFGLIRHEALRTTRLLDDFYSADIVLLAELALLGRFVEIPEQLFQRRWEDRSAPPDKSKAAVDRWYNPDTRRKHHFRRTRLFREITRSILRAPIPGGEKLRAIQALYGVWGPRYARTVAGEFRRAAEATVGRSRV